MATTYKKLASYFLQRDLTTTVPGIGAGYYYGGEGSPTSTTVLDDFNSNFNSIKLDTKSPLATAKNLFLALNPNANGSVSSTALQSNGKIIIGGSFNSLDGVTTGRLARLNSDGTLDTGFNPNASSTVRTIVLQPDGKILVGGAFATMGGVTVNRIARLNSDGTLDASFVNPNADSTVNSIALQPDGKIIIGGFFAVVGGVIRSQIARLNSDGSLDTSFDPNAIGIVYSIVPQPDGKIIIGGSFDTIGGVTRNRIARLNSDGTLDTSFNPNANWDVSAIAVQPDGKIVIAGEFTTIAGVEKAGVVRLREVVSNAPYRLAYTVPENTQVIVKNIFATNHNDFPVFHDIAILPEADDQEGISEKHYYVWDNLVDDNEYEVIESGVTLSAGDEIYVYSSTDEDISYNIFGVEITE